MTELHIPDVEPWLVEALRARAEQEGSALEVWLKALLLRKVPRTNVQAKQRIINEMRQLVEEAHKAYGTLNYSTRFIREERDQQGLSALL